MRKAYLNNSGIRSACNVEHCRIYYKNDVKFPNVKEQLQTPTTHGGIQIVAA
jgi:hypothetical protein